MHTWTTAGPTAAVERGPQWLAFNVHVRLRGDDDFSAYAAGRWASLVRAAVPLGYSPADAEDLAHTTDTCPGPLRSGQTAEVRAADEQGLVQMVFDVTERDDGCWPDAYTSCPS